MWTYGTAPALCKLIFENGSIDEAGFEKAGKLRSEFVIAVTGTVERRSGAVNENLKTGTMGGAGGLPESSFRV